MKAKKVAIILISILIFSILLLIITIFLLLKSVNTGPIQNITTNGETTNETITNNNSIENNNITGYQNETGSDNGFDFDPEQGMDIFSEEDLEGIRHTEIYTETSNDGNNTEVKYSEEDINNFELEVKDIPEEIIANIADKEEIIFKMKRYLYENPQIKATEAVYKEYRLINQETRINDELFIK